MEKSSVLFLFHSWLVHALLLWRWSTLPVLSSNSLKTEEGKKKKKNLQTMSRTDEQTGAHKLTHTCQGAGEANQGGVYSQWRANDRKCEGGDAQVEKQRKTGNGVKRPGLIVLIGLTFNVLSTTMPCCVCAARTILVPILKLRVNTSPPCMCPHPEETELRRGQRRTQRRTLLPSLPPSLPPFLPPSLGATRAHGPRGGVTDMRSDMSNGEAARRCPWQPGETC